MSEPLRPDRAALLRWLVSPAVVRPTGEVMSWGGSGAFAYPEAGGFLLRLLVLERDAPGCEDAIAAWLARGVRKDAIRRDGVRHAFDLAIVAHALFARDRARRTAGDEGHHALRSAVDDIDLARAHDGPPNERWSGVFGPHLRKVAFAISASRVQLVDVLADLWRKTGGHDFDPRAPTPGASATYLHACAYALEGTVLLSSRYGDGDRVSEAMEWFARLQRSDGGMPAWADGERGFGPTRADATAQAVRLWAWLDRRRWEEPIARGLDWLARATVPGGGVRYADDCDHQNTWATVFTIQALDFADGRGSGDTLV
jgi:hypothetical protein